ncbi:unannotated protein [freshwater metagenome]|uniref:Unannotated protein n=1 Tax=freshwater metagenome TaxID=449393 RepID=A0A6J7VXG7_9ZZZZ
MYIANVPVAALMTRLQSPEAKVEPVGGEVVSPPSVEGVGEPLSSPPQAATTIAKPAAAEPILKMARRVNFS